MTVRTTFTTVTFSMPFVLDGLLEELPAGTYQVETDEELLEGVSFPFYRRVLTIIHVERRANQSILTRSLTINPGALDAALGRDRTTNGDAV